MDYDDCLSKTQRQLVLISQCRLLHFRSSQDWQMIEALIPAW